jgi:hypothetical protein
MPGIIIDDREDTRLLNELSRFDIPIHTFRLESVNAEGHNVSMGDAVFAGSGPDGPVQIAFERKRLTDLVTCIKDRRLARQLKDMRSVCAYDRIYVVVEGIWKPSVNGMVEVLNGDGRWHPMFAARGGEGITYDQIDGFLQSICESGVVVHRTGNTQETAMFYISRYRWWQKPYHQHRAMDQLYSNDPNAQRRGKMIIHQGDPSPVCQVAAQFPGIDAKAWSVAEQFKSIYELVTGHAMEEWEFRAAVARWQRTSWTDSSGKEKRFGRKTATEIVKWMSGNGNGKS